MSKLFVSGVRTTIWREMRPMVSRLPKAPDIVACQTDLGSFEFMPSAHIPICDRYLLAMGRLVPTQLSDMPADEVERSLAVNLVAPMRIIDHALSTNPDARICVIGSESGIAGSYNEIYAAANAALHHYVETRRTEPAQQLVCIAPGMIEDSGMTERRDDQENVSRRRREHPKGRLLTAYEVARMAFHLLYVDEGYTTGCVVPMIGGRRA